MRPRLQRALFTLLRAGIGFGLAAFLIWKVIDKTQVDLPAEWRQAHWGLLALAFAIYGLVQVVTTVRWRMLLAVQGVHVPLWGLFRLTMIGQFFNLAIPGAVGGDLIKMGYISQRAKASGKSAEAILTIAVDRIMGLLGLLVVATASVLACLTWMLHDAPHQIRMTTLFVAFASLGGIGFVAVLELREIALRLPGARALLAWSQAHLPARLVGLVGRLVGALDLYRTCRLKMLQALLWSILVHSLLAGLIFCLGRAYGETQVGPRHYFLATQVANTIGAIPAVPGGFGLRDITLAPFLEAAGAALGKAGAIAVSFSLIMAAWSTIGCVFFALTRYQPAPPPPSAS